MIDSASVTLTDGAMGQLKSVLEKETTPGLGLRVYVAGGGCSGLEYRMALDDVVRPGDEVIIQDGVRVLIDDFSWTYLRGSEIDYVDDLMQSGFTVNNPNAVRTCSCGHSFDTGDDASSASACGCGH